MWKESNEWLSSSMYYNHRQCKLSAEEISFRHKKMAKILGVLFGGLDTFRVQDILTLLLQDAGCK